MKLAYIIPVCIVFGIEVFTMRQPMSQRICVIILRAPKYCFKLRTENPFQPFVENLFSSALGIRHTGKRLYC